MTSIIDRLNNGSLHAAARARRPECVDAKGNIHVTADRASFVNWLDKMRAIYGSEISEWPQIPRDEYKHRYVPSH